MLRHLSLTRSAQNARPARGVLWLRRRRRAHPRPDGLSILRVRRILLPDRLHPVISTLGFGREKSTLKNFALRAQADFIYTCTMMFGPELMREMAALAEGMRPGAVFVTVMLPLPSDAFEVVCTEPCLFSWGEVEVVVHRRKPRDDDG